MQDYQVVAQVPAKGDTKQLGPATVTVKSPDTCAEAIEMFGDEVVLSNALANWTVTLQGGIRARLKKGMSADQIQTELGPAKMGSVMRSAQVDPQQAFIAKFRTATPEQQAEMLAKLQEAAAAA